MSDLNRVCQASNYIVNILRGYGYEVDYDPIFIQHKESINNIWQREDIPLKSQMDKYLKNISAIREAISVYETTPEPPSSMDNLTWQQANDIEKILFDLDEIITKMEQAWFYSGDLYSGEV